MEKLPLSIHSASIAPSAQRITRPGGGRCGGTRARDERPLQHQHRIRLRLRPRRRCRLPAPPCPALPRPAPPGCAAVAPEELSCRAGPVPSGGRCAVAARGPAVPACAALGHAAVAARSAGLCAARPPLSQAMSAAPQGPDLSFLDEEEARAIFQVLQRDAELRRAEKDRVRYRLSAPCCRCRRGGGGRGMGLRGQRLRPAARRESWKGDGERKRLLEGKGLRGRQG